MFFRLNFFNLDDYLLKSIEIVIKIKILISIKNVLTEVNLSIMIN